MREGTVPGRFEEGAAGQGGAFSEKGDLMHDQGMMGAMMSGMMGGMMIWALAGILLIVLLVIVIIKLNNK